MEELEQVAKPAEEKKPEDAPDPRITALETALRISEEARKSQVQTSTRETAAPAPAPEPEKLLTREEIQKVYEDEPLKAIEMMQQQAIKLAARQFEERLRPLQNGGIVSAEAQARTKYAEAFEVLGPEIQKIVDSLPDRNVLSQPQAWDDLVSYVQGKPDNIERIISKRMEKAGQSNGSTAPQVGEMISMILRKRSRVA
jgi:hypothetical protein